MCVWLCGGGEVDLLLMLMRTCHQHTHTLANAIYTRRRTVLEGISQHQTDTDKCETSFLCHITPGSMSPLSINIIGTSEALQQHQLWPGLQYRLITDSQICSSNIDKRCRRFGGTCANISATILQLDESIWHVCGSHYIHTSEQVCTGPF